MKYSRRLIVHAQKKTLPVLTGYLFLGLGFGVLFARLGYGVLDTAGMCLLVYSGTMQYAVTGLLAGHAALAEAAVTTLIVNARYLFYSVSLIDRYRKVKRHKPLMIHMMADEAYAIVTENDVPAGETEEDYWFLVQLFNYLYWLIGCALGTLLGNLFAIDARGVEFVMTALFITIFIDQWQKEKDHTPALMGVCVTLFFLLVLGRERFMIPAMLVLAGFFSFYRGKGDQS